MFLKKITLIVICLSINNSILPKKLDDDFIIFNYSSNFKNDNITYSIEYSKDAIPFSLGSEVSINSDRIYGINFISSILLYNNRTINLYLLLENGIYNIDNYFDGNIGLMFSKTFNKAEIAIEPMLLYNNRFNLLLSAKYDFFIFEINSDFNEYTWLIGFEISI